MSHFPSPHPPLLPSSAAALHQQVQFQSHFHVTTATSRRAATAAPESRALERRKKSTEGRANLHIGFGVAFAEETRGDRGKERVKLSQQPTASGVHRRGQM